MPPLEIEEKIDIKFDNCPIEAIPAGPIIIAKTLLLMSLEIILIIVDRDVQVKILIRSFFLKWLNFKIISKYISFKLFNSNVIAIVLQIQNFYKKNHPNCDNKNLHI